MHTFACNLFLDNRKNAFTSASWRPEKAEPPNALALFYLRAAAEAVGNKPAALQRWKTLLALLPADAPIRGMLEERIKAAGVRVHLSPSEAGIGRQFKRKWHITTLTGSDLRSQVG